MKERGWEGRGEILPLLKMEKLCDGKVYVTPSAYTRHCTVRCLTVYSEKAFGTHFDTGVQTLMLM